MIAFISSPQNRKKQERKEGVRVTTGGIINCDHTTQRYGKQQELQLHHAGLAHSSAKHIETGGVGNPHIEPLHTPGWQGVGKELKRHMKILYFL